MEKLSQSRFSLKVFLFIISRESLRMRLNRSFRICLSGYEYLYFNWKFCGNAEIISSARKSDGGLFDEIAEWLDEHE